MIQLQQCFPRLYAAASLKQESERAARVRRRDAFSAALCRGLIEAAPASGRGSSAAAGFSAALCRGLIEAGAGGGPSRGRRSFSAALCRGLIEAASASPRRRMRYGFSAALCRGLIEARCCPSATMRGRWAFSAALCRGLIEAGVTFIPVGDTSTRFPRLYAAASLKLEVGVEHLVAHGDGFPRLYAAASLKRVGRADLHDDQGGFPRLYAAASLKRPGPTGD